MTQPIRHASSDLVDRRKFFSRVLTKLNSVWVSATFPFASKCHNLSLHYTSDISRPSARHIRLGSGVQIGKHTWLSPSSEDNDGIKITIEDDCQIGARCTISAKNSIHLERDVALASDVLIIDNNHGYEDVAAPIAQQGTTPGGTIRIGEGCRIGSGVAVVCERGELTLGRNSIVAPRSVVTRSFPPNSVLSGNPARIVRGSGAPEAIGLNDSPIPVKLVDGMREKIAPDPHSTNSETPAASRQVEVKRAPENRGLISRAWPSVSRQDLRGLISRVLSKLRTLWLTHTYPFSSFGKGAWAHHSLRVDRSSAPYISIAERVGFAEGVRLEVSAAPGSKLPILIMEAGSGLQRRGMISARNRIHIMKESIFGFSVRIMDHGLEHQTDTVAIGTQRKDRRDHTHRRRVLDWFWSRDCLRGRGTGHRTALRGGCELRDHAQHSSLFGCRRRSRENCEAIRFCAEQMGIGMHSPAQSRSEGTCLGGYSFYRWSAEAESE